ncbi:MAG: hypothetical protein IPO16_08140 [Saprospiraceae bacterium]|nr:hypothetical protein [Saprospiraceae bacterium]
MRHKQFIVYSLVLANFLMFAHDAIPHHHHESKEEAEAHHQSEYFDHQHHGNIPSEGHSHTPHLIHSPDFGAYLFANTSNFIDILQLDLNIALVVPSTYLNSYVDFINEVVWFPGLPPPYQNRHPKAHSLRGPPYFIS